MLRALLLKGRGVMCEGDVEVEDIYGIVLVHWIDEIGGYTQYTYGMR